MILDLKKLNYFFIKKPVLVGGKAMEFYGLRKSGADIDLIASEEDIAALIKLYPDRVKDLWGDLGVCPFEFEIWRTINLLDYSFYSKDAIEKENFLIISIEKLMLMKALAMKKEKYLNDLNLITEFIIKNQYKKYEEQVLINKRILQDIPSISYIQKTGPKD